MSGSEAAPIEVAGASDAADPVEALRDALSELLERLVAAGCGPQHLKAMRWEVAEPARFHPSRREIELAYREVFAGFRAPVTLARGEHPGVHAVATADRAAAPSDARVYGEYDLAALARQYSPRVQADMNAVFKRWSAEGGRFRAAHGGLDLAYGPSRDEGFDLYLPDSVARPPVWIFIHGGYWQASDKSQHAQFAQGMLSAGYAVAMPNYGLAPETSLSGIVEQVAQFLAFLVREGDNLGIDGAHLHLAGHSAGAHLAAMVAARDTLPAIRSVLLLSGLFDLAPLALLPVGKLLGLRPRSTAVLSPALLPPPKGLRVGLAVGESESDEFKRQSRLLASAWGAPEPMIMPGHHFGMLDGLNRGALLDLALSLGAAS